MRTNWSRDDRYAMKTDTLEVFHNYTDQAVFTEFHAHDFYEVLFFLSGQVDYAVENRLYALRPGSVVLTDSSELHRTVIGQGGNYERYVLWLRPDCVRRLEAASGTPLSGCFDASARSHCNLLRPNAALFRSMLQRLESLLAPAEDAEARVLRGCALTELLVFLNQAQRGTVLVPGLHVVSDPKIDELIFYVNQHLAESLPLDDLAEHFYISKYHLSRLFKACMGMPLHQYILNKRLLYAKSLLAAGAGAGDACMGSGFNNYAHFSRAFKTFFGYSPSLWNREHNSGDPLI